MTPLRLVMPTGFIIRNYVAFAAFKALQGKIINAWKHKTNIYNLGSQQEYWQSAVSPICCCRIVIIKTWKCWCQMYQILYWWICKTFQQLMVLQEISRDWKSCGFMHWISDIKTNSWIVVEIFQFGSKWPRAKTTKDKLNAMLHKHNRQCDLCPDCLLWLMSAEWAHEPLSDTAPGASITEWGPQMADLTLIVRQYNMKHTLWARWYSAVLSINLPVHPSSNKDNSISIASMLLSHKLSQLQCPAQIILCPFSELTPWHWAMGKCIRIDYLSCRQIWWCGRLSHQLPGWYWIPWSINNILCGYTEPAVR